MVEAVKTKLQPIDIYPYTVDASSDVVFQAMKGNFCAMIEELGYPRRTVRLLYRCFEEVFDISESLFNTEELARQQGIEGANLYYHGKPHAVFQIGYDAISIVRNLNSRQDKLSEHLTTEGALATVFGSMFHDCGYVSGFEGHCENYAARTPIHVQAGIESFDQIFDTVKLPAFIDSKKVKALAKIGIHSTHFPFTPERKQERKQLINQLPLEDRKEAMIVALAIQLADLGGQLARIDYSPTGLVDLRAEMNAANPEANLGTVVIGEDGQLIDKFRGFLKILVLPTVGRTAHALLGKHNKFLTAWARHIGIDLKANDQKDFRTLLTA